MQANGDGNRSDPRWVVAIDGPAGSGKSTLAAGLALKLGLPWINTGLMYRALARLAREERVDPEDGTALAERAASMAFALSGGPAPRLLIDGRVAENDPSLTSAEVESVVSGVSRHPEVRQVMRDRQRALGRGGAVMEGRDIGTVVFPDADVKIFVLAAPEVRANRRQTERGPDSRVARAVARRDELDARTNPLVPSPDAHVLDTTHLEPAEMVEEALRIVRRVAGERR